MGKGPVTFGDANPSPPHMAPGHFPSVASDPVGSKVTNSSHAGGVDALDSFDIPPSSGIASMDDIDDISLKQSVGSDDSKSAIVVEPDSGSVWPKNQDLDQELDRVLKSQQLNASESLQSLNRLEPFSTKSGTSPHGLGVKSVSVDISSLPTFDSGLGSMPSSNISSDNKKSLQNGTGTSQNADVVTSAMNNINIVAGSSHKLPATNGGQIGGMTTITTTTTTHVTQSEQSTATTVGGSETQSKTDAIQSMKDNSISTEKVVVKDFSDGMDTSAVEKLPGETGENKIIEKDNVPTIDSLDRKSPMIEVDIRDKAPSVKLDPKLDLVGNVAPSSEDVTVSAIEYQKLVARYKIVHNACKNFQENRKNMKSMMTQTFVLKVRTCGMNTEPFMEFEELKVIKERLQGSLRDAMQKYMHLQRTSSSDMNAMKEMFEKKDAKEKELTVALADVKRQHENDLKQWQAEKTHVIEDTRIRDSKIQQLESEKNILQNQLAIKDREIEELKRKTQVDRDLWVAEKMKLQETFQASERNQKLLLQRAIEGEILLLQERCKMGSHALESWIREGEFHLNNFKINLQRTPDNLKMKEGFNQWHNAVAENKQKLDQLKIKYEGQIREIHSGRLLSQLATIDVPTITKPSLPPLPPPGAFMGGPRPGFIPPHIPSGIRPSLDMTRPPHIPQSTSSPISTPSPSPSPTLSQTSTNSVPSQPISVPVSLVEDKAPKGPAKVTPAQVTVPLQEQAPWPPASLTPGHSSPPGFPSVQTAPSTLPAGGSSTANSLGAVGSSRPQSVSGASATPGNNRPVKQPPTAPNPAAAGGSVPAVPVAQQPRTNFERILFPLQSLFPQHNQVQLTKAIKEVRQANNGSLSGLSVDEIIRRAASVLKHQPPMRAAAGTAGATTGAGANKGWQNNNGEVPQGQRLVQGVMQGMAAQQGKFQWSSELGGSSAFKTKGFLDDDEDPCVICHEEMTPETIKILECGHHFHAECIKQWLNEQSTCPNCRHYTLLPDEYPSL
ncbi:uncharacterized protein [Amphiura filiformis]|uniref:uncharacterized protein n=1 Tax=Amphiura filiformis TaxID=82378 RepID=UPI003B21CF1D